MQARAWSIVPLAKLGSWFLLMLVSYALVCLVNTPTAADDVESTRDRLYGGLGAGPILDRGNLDPGLAAREARVGTVRRDGNRDR
jgi:hypothetical protein